MIRNRLIVRESKVAITNKLALIELDDDYRRIPAQQETAKALADPSAAETELLFVYTGSEHDDYTYEGQLFAMFPQLRQSLHVCERYLKEPDHTLILKSDRSMVIQWICVWCDKVAFSRTI